MPTDDFKGLRGALAAGPTKGPWLTWGGTHLVIRKHSGGPDSEDLRICEVAYNSRNDESRHNTKFIAAANPATIAALLAELDRVRGDAERLDYLESMIQLGKIEIARSLLGAGYEFGHWVKKGPTVQVHSGSLRAAIDAARGKGKEGGS
jgi:hypothetical protein